MEQSMLGTNILLLVARALCGKKTTARVYASFEVENRLKRGMSVENAVEAVKKEVLENLQVAIDDWRQPGIDFGMGAFSGDRLTVLFKDTSSAINFLEENGLPKTVFLDYHLDVNPHPKSGDDFSITTLPYIDALREYCIKHDKKDKFQDIIYVVISDHEKRARIHHKWLEVMDEFHKESA
jgi:hypothetical protein